MKTNRIFSFIWRILVLSLCLTVIQILVFSLGTALFAGNAPAAETESPGLSLLLMFCVSFVITVVFFPVLMRSRFKRFKRMASIAIVFFIVYSGLSMLEMILFNSAVKLSSETIILTLFVSSVSSILFSVIAVFLTEKTRLPVDNTVIHIQITSKPINLSIKILILCLVIYPLLYFVFGTIAAQTMALKEYYAEMMGNNSVNILTLYFLQIFRGLIWVGTAVLLVIQLRNSWLQTAVITGFIFALVMNIVHILPNPFMPPEVQFVHFFETSISNFIWGFACVWLLRKWKIPVKNSTKK